MKLPRARAAIEELARRGSVAKLLRVNEVRKNPALVEDGEYRAAFIGYYKMGRRPPAFYEAFFAMLHDAAAGKLTLPLEEVMSKLYRRIGQRHLSFCSKLLATVDDSAVVFDRNVASYFDVPWRTLPRHRWLDEALRRHAEIRKGILTFVEKPEWPAMRALFDRTFPGAVHLPDIRKADLIIWAHGATS